MQPNLYKLAGTAATGEQRIAAAFADARQAGRRAALMPFLMGGFPTLEASHDIAQAYVDGGADLVELGIPFSHPVADGPVIRSAGAAALRAGASVDGVLEVAAAVAPRAPVVVMSYANLVLSRGPQRFADALRDAGVSGLIVPDLPLDERTRVLAACDAAGVALVPVVAPTTPGDRLARIAAQARGFLYTMSVGGKTGERAALPDGADTAIQRAKLHSPVPVALGFGISTPAHAAQAADAGADGVIIGSRLVRAAAEAGDPAAGVRGLVDEFALALAGWASSDAESLRRIAA